MEEPSRQSALDLLYIKLLRLSLLPIGGWPNFNQNEQNSLFNFRIVNTVIQVLVVIGQIIYLHDIFGKVEFLLVGDVYITTFLTVLSVVRLSLPQFKTYCIILRAFITEFHLIYFKHKGETYQTAFLLMEKFSRYLTFFMSCLAVSGLVLFNLSPMYKNIKNGAFTTNKHNLTNIDLEFSVKYKYPGFDPNENFIFTTVNNVYLCSLCTFSIVAIDLLVILMTFQIIGHLELLAMNMKSMPKPKTVHVINVTTIHGGNLVNAEIFDREENLEIKQKLKDFVGHHKLIISFTQNMSQFFGPFFGATYLFHLVCCCLLLLECSRMDPGVIVQFLPLTAVIFTQLIQISVTFEVVQHKSSALIDCVYDLPWQCMSIDNQRIVSIMFLRVQMPVQVTAFGLADVGVKTMANILKTTFSYYTFLRQL